MTETSRIILTRRSVCSGLAGTAALSVLPQAAGAQVPQTAAEMQKKLQAAMRELFGDREMTEGRVTLTLPPIAENGFSVPVSIDVDSPMIEADHVRRIAVFAERNPIPTLFQCHLGPRAGRASVATRLRLAGSQTVRAVAEMSDDTLWLAQTEVVVTLAACVVL